MDSIWVKLRKTKVTQITEIIEGEPLQKSRYAECYISKLNSYHTLWDIV